MFHSIILIVSVLSTAAEAKEPPLGYTLTIDGRSQRLILGEEKKLSGIFSQPTVVLDADSERRFDKANLSFLYPAYFAFEADVSEANYKSWTLTGNDVHMTIYWVEGLEMQPFIRNLIAQFGQGTTAEPIQHRFSDKTRQGQRVKVNIAGTKIRQDIFELRRGKKNLLVVVQDNPSQGGQPSAEGRRVWSLLDRSLKLLH